MNILGIDLGERHTGVAFLDTNVGISMPVTVIHHKSTSQLRQALYLIIEERTIDHLVFGLPYLPSGDEGSQADVVRTTVDDLHIDPPTTVSFVDERYTNTIGSTSSDHTDAACAILTVYQDRAKSS